MARLSPGCEELTELGDKFMRTRMAQKISLRQFAIKIDLSPSFYSKIERAEQVASAEAYTRICNELKLDPETTLAKIGMVDSETQKEFEELYRAHAGSVKGLLRQWKGDKD